MGFYFDGSGQRTHRPQRDEIEREGVEQLRPSPGKSSRTHGGGAVRGIPGKVSLTMRLAQRIDRYTRDGRSPDERAREMVAEALGSTGQPLPQGLRGELEAHANTHLADVHIHTGPESARAAEALGAEAFTVGRDIHFATGTYDPDSAAGRRLIAHEVAHAIQQRSQPKLALEQAAISEPGQEHERYADEFAGLFERSETDRSGTSLPCETRARMERSFGHSFADVHVYPDSPKATGRTHAVTEGRAIHFARDRYAPGTERGDWLIGHELTHVVQQTGSIPGPQAQGNALEAEADASADAIMAGRRAVVELSAPMGAAQAYEDEATIHGTPVRKQGIVSHRDGVNLRDRPLPGSGSNVLQRLPFNTTLFVDTETSDGWYHVTLSTGEFGYVVKTHVNTNLPEPTAKLHEITSGETAVGIAETYYGSHAKWSEDLRFYVNVLEFVNRGSGKRGIYKQNPDDSWQATKAREGYLIWIPGLTFARSLKGQVQSGSISYEAWSAVKDAAVAAGEFAVGGAALVAGLLHGALESLWDILVGVKDLGVMAWKVLKSVFTGSVLSDAKALYEQIAALDLGALVAGWIDDFEKKWNDASIMKRWHFRGWVIGYAIMEIVLLVASFGVVTGAKWAGKAAKLAKAITSLPRVQKTIKAVKSIKVPPKLKEGLSKVFKGGEKLEDAGDVGKGTKSAGGGASKGTAGSHTDGGGASSVKAFDDALTEGIPRHTSARLGEPSSAEIRSLRKKYSLDSDSEAAALWHVQHQKSAKGVIAGEREIKKALDIDPNKSGEKMTDLLKTDNRGLKVPIEVKNQKELHLSGKGNAALAKFENIAKHADMEGISHFEVLCHLDSKLPPNFRVGTDGVLLRLISGSRPPRWNEVLIGGKKVYVKAGALGEISR